MKYTVKYTFESKGQFENTSYHFDTKSDAGRFLSDIANKEIDFYNHSTDLFGKMKIETIEKTTEHFLFKYANDENYVFAEATIITNN